MDATQQQKFKLKHLLDSVNSLVLVYKEKGVLSEQISEEEYNNLLNKINEFSSRFLS